MDRDFKNQGPYKGVAGGTGSSYSWHFCLVDTKNLSKVCSKSYSQTKWDKGLKIFVEQLEIARQ